MADLKRQMHSEIDAQRSRITNSIRHRIDLVAQKLAKEKGLTFVLCLNPDVVAYVNPDVVITEQVIRTYNASSPVHGSSTAAP